MVVAITITITLAKKTWALRRPPYPPGPKGYPIIGNSFDIPGNPVWEGLARMAQEHDTDILHLDLPGCHLIVLSDSDTAIDLMERRSAAYSDRPQPPMLSELMGLSSWTFSMMPYGSIWRTHRRLFHRFFNVGVADLFDDKIEKAVNVFAHRLSESPERFLDHTRFLTGSLALSVAYGLNIESENNKFYRASEGAMSAVDEAMVPGRFFVDIFPILKHIPEWFPGAGWKKFGRMTKEKLYDSITLPFQAVKESFQANTTTTSSFVGTCLEELPQLGKDGVDEEVIRGVGGIIYLGGEETTASALGSFFLAATLHPEIVRLAQKELDEVIGGDRLPDLSDKHQLPYITAIAKEVLRWRPSAPVAAARWVMEDDVYKGLAIPPRTALIGNIWAMLHNESVYPNPNVFDPSRFLKDGQIDPNVKDPEQITFGWGRRICPGKHFAVRVLWLTIARVLATFDVSKCLDENGDTIVPDGKYTFGGVTHPLPFKSNIKPRSTHALSLIARE